MRGRRRSGGKSRKKTLLFLLFLASVSSSVFVSGRPYSSYDEKEYVVDLFPDFERNERDLVFAGKTKKTDDDDGGVLWTQKTSRLREKSMAFPPGNIIFSDEEKETASNTNATPLERAAGYFKLNRTTHDAHMFYMFFEHRGGGEASKGGRKGGEEKVPVVL